MTAPSPYRLVGVTLGEAAPRSREIENEREIALHDLLESNSFAPVGSHAGPYTLVLGIEQNRLVFDIHLEDGAPHGRVMLSLTALRRVVKDYFAVCESYFKAIPDQPSARIEALDMGRRGLHDEGARLLCERLKDKIVLDFDTARRLFTLICVLQMKG